MNVWNALYRFALAILGVLFFAGAAVAYYSPLKEYRTLSAREMQLTKEVNASQARFEQKKHDEERLLNDPRFIEKVAREQFGYCKPGETVFKFEGDENPAARVR